MGPHDGGVHRDAPVDLARDIGSGLNLLQQTPPRPVGRPQSVAFIDGLPGAEPLGKIPPLHSGSHPMQDPIDHLSVIPPSAPTSRLSTAARSTLMGASTLPRRSWVQWVLHSPFVSGNRPDDRSQVHPSPPASHTRTSFPLLLHPVDLPSDQRGRRTHVTLSHIRPCKLGSQGSVHASLGLAPRARQQARYCPRAEAGTDDGRAWRTHGPAPGTPLGFRLGGRCGEVMGRRGKFRV